MIKMQVPMSYWIWNPSTHNRLLSLSTQKNMVKMASLLFVLFISAIYNNTGPVNIWYCTYLACDGDNQAIKIICDRHDLNCSDLNFNVSCTSWKMKNLEASCYVLFLFCEKKGGLKDIYKNRKKQVHCLFSFFFGLGTSKNGLIRLNKLSIFDSNGWLVELRIVFEKTLNLENRTVNFTKLWITTTNWPKRKK